METECPCCFLEYNISSIKRVQLHDWIQVTNDSAKHWVCNLCHAKIIGFRGKKKCPHCRVSLNSTINPNENHTQTPNILDTPYISTEIQPYVPPSPPLHHHLRLL